MLMPKTQAAANEPLGQEWLLTEEDEQAIYERFSFTPDEIMQGAISMVTIYQPNTNAKKAPEGAKEGQWYSVNGGVFGYQDELYGTLFGLTKRRTLMSPFGSGDEHVICSSAMDNGEGRQHFQKGPLWIPSDDPACVHSCAICPYNPIVEESDKEAPWLSPGIKYDEKGCKMSMMAIMTLYPDGAFPSKESPMQQALTLVRFPGLTNMRVYKSIVTTDISKARNMPVYTLQSLLTTLRMQNKPPRTVKIRIFTHKINYQGNHYVPLFVWAKDLRYVHPKEVLDDIEMMSVSIEKMKPALFGQTTMLALESGDEHGGEHALAVASSRPKSLIKKLHEEESTTTRDETSEESSSSNGVYLPDDGDDEDGDDSSAYGAQETLI